MLSLRLAVVFGVAALMSARLTTCRSPGEGGAEPSPSKPEQSDVTLAGVDTSALTSREKSEWSRYVSEFLTPCADQPVSIAQCVKEARACKACAPAAKYLVELARHGQVRAQVEAAYKARFSPEAVHAIDLQGAPSKGPDNARVVVTEFADFQCPVCGAKRPVIEEVLKKHSSDMRLVFKHFPITFHENAEKAARAAVAAQRQNKFWEMHAALFENQQNLAPENVENLAKGIGLDMKHFLADRDSEVVADAVTKDRKQGEALGVKGTPSLFINGRMFVPGDDFAEDLDAWITLEVELSPEPSPSKAAVAPAAPESAAAASPSARGPKPVPEKAAAHAKSSASAP